MRKADRWRVPGSSRTDGQGWKRGLRYVGALFRFRWMLLEARITFNHCAGPSRRWFELVPRSLGGQPSLWPRPDSSCTAIPAPCGQLRICSGYRSFVHVDRSYGPGEGCNLKGLREHRDPIARAAYDFEKIGCRSLRVRRSLRQHPESRAIRHDRTRLVETCTAFGNPRTNRDPRIRAWQARAARDKAATLRCATEIRSASS